MMPMQRARAANKRSDARQQLSKHERKLTISEKPKLGDEPGNQDGDGERGDQEHGTRNGVEPARENAGDESRSVSTAVARGCKR